MKKSDQNEKETFCTILEPDETAGDDFEGWQQEQKADLEALGIVVTRIEGATFYGYEKSTNTNSKS